MKEGLATGRDVIFNRNKASELSMHRSGKRLNERQALLNEAKNLRRILISSLSHGDGPDETMTWRRGTTCGRKKYLSRFAFRYVRRLFRITKLIG
jgi:hypothetical protein